MLVSSLDLASSGTCVAAPTTAAPTMCHIDASEIGPAADVEESGEQRLERAVAAMGDPGRQRRLTGQADHSVTGEVGGARLGAVAEERIVWQRPQRRIDDAHPVDCALGVDVHPQVLQAGVPCPPLEHDAAESRGR